MKTLLIVYLVGHLVLCLLIYLGIHTRFFKFSEQLFPLIVLVPVFGVIAGLIADYHSRFHKAGVKPLSLDEMHLSKDDLRLHRIEEDSSVGSVIPLEEAMAINDAETRRKLMLDILHQNPDEYIELLQEARLDDDIEVTHYASTAIMEMQREYELSMQQTEKAYMDDPESGEKRERYLHSLQRYIDSGLIDDNVVFVYRQRYADLLDSQMQAQPSEMEPYLRGVDNYLELGNYTQARFLADRLINTWPGSERAWFAKLKTCQAMNDGEGLRATVEDMKKRRVYLTPEGRIRLSFWDPEMRKEEPPDAADV